MGSLATAASGRLKELTRPTGEEDVMHVDYPPPRVRVEPRTAVAAVLAVAALLGGWFVLRPQPAELPPAQWGAVAEASTSVAPAEVVVSVVGAVEQPGLVTLPDGARVAEALAQAHPLPDADLVSVNQAQVLVDGQQIHVQALGAAPLAPDAVGGPSSGLVSLNSATAEQLTSLPGVGQATAAAIVAHREANGPFATVDQLEEVKGIGPAKFAALKDLVTV
ncbi:ComEA family DNA-binding protein [Corynebacterium sp. LK2510]|uniref:ComEA family DNA-binding protein n=1 Tax=Corynebacterium sp. LK2510 TaxID=3110472 RepID=UPI0034CEBBC7